MEIFKKNTTTHHLSNNRLYKIYKHIKQRCYNKNKSRYKNYGGRGIKVCDEWLGENGFINFYNWAVDNGYKEDILPNGRNKWTIDRIDVNGNYEPNNCRWITLQEQADNKTNTVKLTYKGETLTRKEWAKRLGLVPSSLQARLRKGWSLEKTLSTQTRRKNKQVKLKENK